MRLALNTGVVLIKYTLVLILLTRGIRQGTDHDDPHGSSSLWLYIELPAPIAY